MMDKEMLSQVISEIKLELELISMTVPSNYEEFNEIRLRMDIAQTRAQAVQSLRQLMEESS